MINQQTSEWTYVPNTPVSDKCDLDIAAEVILDRLHYKPKELSIEEYTERLVADFTDEAVEDNIDIYRNLMLNPDIFEAWLKDRMLSEYDYKA